MNLNLELACIIVEYGSGSKVLHFAKSHGVDDLRIPAHDGLGRLAGRGKRRDGIDVDGAIAHEILMEDTEGIVSTIW